MLKECGKDWIRAWQHLCVFSPDQLYPVKTHPPQIQTFYRTFLPHVHNTSWYITGILECLEMVSWIVATGVIATFFVQNQCTAVCYMYVCIKIWIFFYKYLVHLGHHCIGRMLTDNIELFKCVPISSSWPSSQKSSEAGSGPDLQVSKWPWVMGLDDYTCSPVITVITLHRHSALLYTWVLWLQAW